MKGKTDMRRLLNPLTLILSVALVAILIGLLFLHPWRLITRSPLISQITAPGPVATGQSGTASKFGKLHIVGGFTIGTPTDVAQATEMGIHVAFEYGDPPSANSTLGRAMLAAHMQVIDGAISSYLQNYECHRTKTVSPPPAGAHPYCGRDTVPISDDAALLSLVKKHLQEVQSNPLILGYWVLDDWALWDAGSARNLLVQFHQLIEQYSPQKPAICGFGASPPSGFDNGWHDGTAANFTPQGCDMIGLYIFTVLQDAQDASASNYDWSMKSTLDGIFSSLQKRGWNFQQTPVIGIAQAFGGKSTRPGLEWPLPTTQDLVTQSQSFCQYGATSIAFYGWEANLYSSQTETPANSKDIQAGIRQGIAACQQIWNSSGSP
jgi:hypothetical protein